VHVRVCVVYACLCHVFGCEESQGIITTSATHVTSRAMNALLVDQFVTTTKPH